MVLNAPFQYCFEDSKAKMLSKRFLSEYTGDVFSLWIREVEWHYIYKRERTE